LPLSFRGFFQEERMKRLRRYLVAGLLVWIPIYVTIAVVQFVTRQLDKTLVFVPGKYQPEELLGFAIPGFGIVLTLLLLLVTGLLAANIVGRSMVGHWESLLERIPFVRAVYSATKRFAEIVLSDSGQSFKKVLLIEYPRKGIYSIAFQTAHTLEEVQYRTKEDVVCAFVPTTPNPTSGFIVLVPRKDVQVLDMEVDEAFKMIVSLGVVVPTWTNASQGDLPLKQREPTESTL
jgi:uncharacterized membrane protein